MKPGHWYMMYSNGLLETFYIQYSNELIVVEVASNSTDPGQITILHKGAGSLFTVVKAK